MCYRDKAILAGVVAMPVFGICAALALVMFGLTYLSSALIALFGVATALTFSGKEHALTYKPLADEWAEGHDSNSFSTRASSDPFFGWALHLLNDWYYYDENLRFPTDRSVSSEADPPEEDFFNSQETYDDYVENPADPKSPLDEADFDRLLDDDDDDDIALDPEEI